MTMLMDAVVKDVEVRRVKKRDGTGEITAYDVVDQTGVKWTAWERELAERAYALKDQPSLFKVDITQNGQYTNRNLRDVQAKPMEGFQPALDALSTSLGSGTAPSGPISAAEKFRMALQDGSPQETAQSLPDVSQKDTYIWRQTATKVAAHLSNSDGEFKANVAQLMHFYRTGEWPDTTPGHSQDSDIPFE